MAPLALAVDYDALRLALVQAVQVGTGLPESQVIMLEPEGMGAPRPRSPYVGLTVTSPSVKMGFDFPTPAKDPPGTRTGNVFYEGPRTMSVSFEAFARTHEMASGIMATWQAALDQPPVQQALEVAGLAVYEIGAVTDISELQATSFEGRAQLDCSFGFTSSMLVDVGLIDTIEVVQTTDVEGTPLITTDTYTREP